MTDRPLPLKEPLFVGHAFPCERDKQPYFKLNVKENVLTYYRVMQRMLGFLGRIAAL